MFRSHNPGIYLFTTVVLAASFAVNASAGASASGSAPVSEQNLDANGLIRTHEQGTALAQVTNLPLDASGNLKTSGSSTVGGTVNIGNTPGVVARQFGTWTVGQQGPWSVGLDAAASSLLTGIQANTGKFNFDGSGNLLTAPTGTQNVGGTVNIGNTPTVNANVTFPTTQNVNVVGGNVGGGFPAATRWYANDGTDAAAPSNAVNNCSSIFEGGCAVFANFAPINATFIEVNGCTRIEISTTAIGGTGGRFDLPSRFEPYIFTQPIPVEGIVVINSNTTTGCTFSLRVIGS